MMITWNEFVYFALSAVLLWIVGAVAAWRGRTVHATVSTALGLTVFFAFILMLWISLERPPLRTLGETRLWYAFFLPLAGMMVYSRWKYKWILTLSTLLAMVFICVNLFKPEIHSKALMPALQSPWFTPHVIVYMFAYAIFGVVTLMAVFMLFAFLSPVVSRHTPHISQLDNLVYVGLAFMTVGMLFGALWAKEAWGHYWSWDPKETWAAATWLSYLCYLHYRLYPRHSQKAALWLLLVCFILLQVCWWGINYLPSAQGTSVHTY